MSDEATTTKNSPVHKLDDKSAVVSSNKAKFVAKKTPVRILEMEDVLFHLNSAVMMLALPESGSGDSGGTDEQEKVCGVQALAVIFKEFDEDPRKRLLVAGHADTSGQVKPNFSLSDLRALNVISLLTGQRETWAGISAKQHKIEDYQQIMQIAAARKGWNCDPGGIDDQHGPKTHTATVEFFKQIGLTEADADTVKAKADKKWSARIWREVYNLYADEMRRPLNWKVDELTAAQLSIKSKLAKKNGKVACGESFPISDENKDNYRSQKDRRVEILIFDKDDIPKIKCPLVTDRTHTKAECPIYNPDVLKPAYVDPGDLFRLSYHLRFTFYDRIKKEVRDVPDGLVIKAFDAAGTEVPVKSDYADGVFTLRLDDDPARSFIHFEFETTDAWIFSDGGDPKIETKPRAEVDALTDDDDRAKWVDLPAKWSSRNYWTRVGDDASKHGRFEKIMRDYKPQGETKTESGKALTFSLEDIVLVDANGRQQLRDKDDSDTAIALAEASRMAIFHLVDMDLLVFDPDPAQKYFSKTLFMKNDAGANPVYENLVVESVPQARTILFANDFYDVWDQRTAQGTTPYSPASDVRGARSAVLNDTRVHRQDAVGHGLGGVAHKRYFADGTGNFELHYVHHGAKLTDVAGIKRRAFLLAYWNCRCKSGGTVVPLPTQAEVDTFRKSGMINAKARWEKKGYTLEPAVEGGNVKAQLKLVFHFEGKEDARGGAHKCMVTVTDESGAWMAPRTSEMPKIDYQDNDYLGVGTYIDVDGNQFVGLTVAHELGHATGKDDDYSYSDRFSQYFPGMPYQYDTGSMMSDNRAPRMKHCWFFVNWLNDATTDPGKLQPLLAGEQFKIVHRYTQGGKKKVLNYHLPTAPGDHRDIYAPALVDLDHDRKIGNLDLAHYHLGQDEHAWSIEIDGKKPKAAFNGITMLQIKVKCKFTVDPTLDASDANNVWTVGKARNFCNDLRNQLTNLNGRFTLITKKEHEFNRTVIGLFPIVIYRYTQANETVWPPQPHYKIEVVLDHSDKIHSKGKGSLKVGSNVDLNWVGKYILGTDDGKITAAIKKLFGKEKLGANHLGFVESWFRSETGAKHFKLEGK